MRTLASLGMGEGQLCYCVVVVVVRCWRWGCAGANESIAFFWRRDVRRWRGKETGYWLLQGGLLLEKNEWMNE